MTRANIEPISESIPAARQDDARHYGVHPYFTRRPSNVVRAYIERFSREGDTVLDPFGGTGVTAIEAFLLARKAIHNERSKSVRQFHYTVHCRYHASICHSTLRDFRTNSKRLCKATNGD
jgi:hypothetical protein